MGQRAEVYLWTLIGAGLIAAVAGHGTSIGHAALVAVLCLVTLWAVSLLATYRRPKQQPGAPDLNALFERLRAARAGGSPVPQAELALLKQLAANGELDDPAPELAAALAQTMTALRGADELLARIAARPEQAALAVLRAGGAELSLNADAPRLLGRTADLLALAEYARQVSEKLLDEESRVPIDELASHAVAAPSLCSKLLEQRGVVDRGTVALRDLADLLLSPGDATARDCLLLRLGRAPIEAACERLGFAKAAAPRPLGGELLAFFSREDLWGPVQSQQGARDTFIDEAWRLGELLRRSPAAVASERHLARTNAVGPRQQLAFDRAVGARGTARALALLLASLLDEELPADRARVVRRILAPCARSGIHGPQLDSLAVASFAPAEGPGAGRVAVLLLDELPREEWLALLNSGAHLELARRLAGDAAFLERARARLAPVAARSPLEAAERAELVAEWRR